MVHATASAFTQTLRVQFAVDLEGFRNRVKNNEPLTLWERIVSGQHPALSYPWPDEKSRVNRALNEAFWRSEGGGVFCGVVTNVKLKYDKRGGLMAFIGMIDGALNYIEVMCFASIWLDAKRVIKAGRLLKLEVIREPDQRNRRRHCYFYQGGRIHWFKTAEMVEGAEIEVEHGMET